MSDNRWERVKLIVDRSAELSSDQRGAYLDEACGDDPALRGEVEALLESCERAPTFLEHPAIDSFADLLKSESPDALIGRRIGSWRVVGHIATGGMGSVFLAERDDRQYDQRVALKLVRQGMADGESIRRFRAERQTLANLDHANIARLLDGGVTEDGLPYLVMEFVEGEPIDAYCDRHKLSTARRLALFLDICAAVRYAHQNLVVHRDLKPSNILVTDVGVPKLLDFGIAKALDAPATSQSPDITGPQRRMMTPAYASPEQIRGEAITTSSDVYSLGVILYELLTGHRPYRPRSSSIYDVERAVCEEEPVRPSTAITRVADIASGSGNVSRTITPEMVSAVRDGEPGKLRRRLAGDIDAIVLTAMRKEPRLRYASVDALADDIRRHLNGLPIEARRAGFGYRTWKFVRRNAIGVAASITVLISLIAGVAGTAWQARLAGRQRDLAVQAQRRAEREAENALVEARKTERVTMFLQEMIAAVDPGHAGRDIMVRDLLNQAADRVHESFGQDPEVESAIHVTLGQTFAALGEYDRAERHTRRALDLQTGIHGDSHPDVARSLSRLAVAHYAKGALDEATQLSLQALEMHQRLHGGLHEDIAQELNNLGAIARARGDFDLAETYLLQALKMRRRLFGEMHVDVAETLNNLGNLERLRGNLSAAEDRTRRALDLRRELLGDHHIDTVRSTENLAVVLANRGDIPQAERLVRRVIDLRRKAQGNNHPELATSLMNLGGICYGAGRFADAEPALREALEIRRSALPRGANHISQSHLLLGACLLGLERYSQAEPQLLKAHERYRSALGRNHARTVTAASTLVDLYESWGKPERAAEFRALLPPVTTSTAASQDHSASNRP